MKNVSRWEDISISLQLAGNEKHDRDCSGSWTKYFIGDAIYTIFFFINIKDFMTFILIRKENYVKSVFPNLMELVFIVNSENLAGALYKVN